MPDRDVPFTVVEPHGIGERLRNAREAKRFSLADAERLTKIRARYLQALEEEQFDRLPGWIYAKGFLRAYATALGLDPDELMEAYPLAFEGPSHPIFGVHPGEVPIRPMAPPSRLRRIVSYTAVIVVLALGFLGFVLYQQLQQFEASKHLAPPRAGTPPAGTQTPTESTPAPEPISPPLTGPEPPPGHATSAPVPELLPLPEPAAPVMPTAPAQPAANEVTVELRASGTSWLRIIADGTRVFEGFVRDGEVRTWRARGRLTVRVGNITAVALTVNGQPVHPSTRGRVWEQTFTVP